MGFRIDEYLVCQVTADSIECVEEPCVGVRSRYFPSVVDECVVEREKCIENKLLAGESGQEPSEGNEVVAGECDKDSIGILAVCAKLSTKITAFCKKPLFLRMAFNNVIAFISEHRADISMPWGIESVVAESNEGLASHRKQRESIVSG